MLIAISFGVVAIVFGFFAIRRGNWFSIAAYAFCMGFIGLSILSSLGQPKPLYLMKNPSGATILGTYNDEPNFSYFLLVPKGERVPILIRTPWNEKFAAQMQNVMRSAVKQNTPTLWGKSKGAGYGEGFLPGRMPLPYPKPQPPLPPKQKRFLPTPTPPVNQ